MTRWRQQAMIDAPVEDVWALVGDPNRYPEFTPKDVVEVTGLPEVERNASYRQVSRVMGQEAETEFRVEEYEDMREIKLRCQASGYYSHWLLTEAQGNTFVEVESGMDPLTLSYRVFDSVLLRKRYWRGMTERAIDGVRRSVERPGD